MVLPVTQILPLIAVFLGATFAFVFGHIKDVQAYRRERSALAAAINAEIDALARQAFFMARVIAASNNTQSQIGRIQWPGVPVSNDIDSFYPYNIPPSVVYNATVSRIGTLGAVVAREVVIAYQRVEEVRLGLKLYADRDEDGESIWSAAAVLKPAKQLSEVMPKLGNGLRTIAPGSPVHEDYDLGATDTALSCLTG